MASTLSILVAIQLLQLGLYFICKRYKPMAMRFNSIATVIVKVGIVERNILDGRSIDSGDSLKCSICLMRDILSLISFSRSLSRCLIFSSCVAITCDEWSLCSSSLLFKMLSRDSILMSLSSMSLARSLVSYSKLINACRCCFLSQSNSSMS